MVVMSGITFSFVKNETKERCVCLWHNKNKFHRPPSKKTCMYLVSYLAYLFDFKFDSILTIGFPLLCSSYLEQFVGVCRHCRRRCCFPVVVLEGAGDSTDDGSGAKKRELENNE